MNIKTVLQEIDAWSVDEQIELLEEMWERLVDTGCRPALTEDQKAELDRRLHALETNPDDVVTWESIVSHVKGSR